MDVYRPHSYSTLHQVGDNLQVWVKSNYSKSLQYFHSNKQRASNGGHRDMNGEWRWRAPNRGHSMEGIGRRASGYKYILVMEDVEWRLVMEIVEQRVAMEGVKWKVVVEWCVIQMEILLK